jgi:hypothetical protein
MKLQLKISDQNQEAMQSLMEATGLKTYEDLMNNALTIFDWTVQARQEGRVIAALEQAASDEPLTKYRVLSIPSVAAFK